MTNYGITEKCTLYTLIYLHLHPKKDLLEDIADEGGHYVANYYQLPEETLAYQGIVGTS